ncbi:Zn-ribbon domain-containing OB-fold protein [Nocardioides litoris]|uniref:Zn-ribbon domain-containing OB-fold protein n=1 Tax=Nocardioides litoris TaxID=1926648 RepID=UPI001120194B|nr:OB-fold domain-containing protein [Nocardioides litoris]
MTSSPPATPVVEGWFTDGAEPALIAARCTACGDLVFPPTAAAACRNPRCAGEEHEAVALSRRGRVWSCTDAQYQPPAPYVAPQTEGEPWRPFALAAVELPEGLVVLGQVADGFGVGDLRVDSEVELVVEVLHVDESGPRTTYRWKPVAS